MSISQHATERVTERLVNDANVDPATAKKVAVALGMLAERSTVRSEAIRCMDLGKTINQGDYDTSNGDIVIAIVRDQRLVTVMLRRSSQPFTTAALKVDKVTAII